MRDPQQSYSSNKHITRKMCAREQIKWKTTITVRKGNERSRKMPESKLHNPVVSLPKLNVFLKSCFTPMQLAVSITKTFNYLHDTPANLQLKNQQEDGSKIVFFWMYKTSIVCLLTISLVQPWHVVHHHTY